MSRISAARTFVPVAPVSDTIAAGRIRPQDDLRWPTVLGAVSAVMLLGAFLLWASLTMIGGAVIADGQAVVRGKPQKVQSYDGGVVSEILVRDGDRVTAGEVMLQLDPTLLATGLEITRNRLSEALARKARLEAEQLAMPAPVFSYPPLPFSLPETGAQEEGQRRIFAARRDLQEGRQALLGERLAQFSSQVDGIDAQLVARRDQLGVIEKDMANIERLLERGLARQSQMSDLQRAHAELLGQIGSLESDRIRIANAMQDARLETLQAERSFREEVVTELRQATAEIEELTLDILNRQDQLDRVTLRAPTDGIVHQLQTTTLRAVIAPGSTVLEIVPLEKGVDFELRLDPRHIDQVWVGQEARVVIAALDARHTPTLEGQVESISPDLVQDPLSGRSYYRVGLRLSEHEIARLGDVALVPGMPVEAYLKTAERSVMQYLTDPLASQLRRSFREN